jgi:hypothetical protein
VFSYGLVERVHNLSANIHNSKDYVEHHSEKIEVFSQKMLEHKHLINKFNLQNHPYMRFKKKKNMQCQPFGMLGFYFGLWEPMGCAGYFALN